MENLDWELLDRISIIAGIIGIPLLIVGFVAMYRETLFQRKIRKSLKEIGDKIPRDFIERREWAAEINTPNPVALCMSLVPSQRTVSIKNDVEQFLKLKGGRFAKMDIKEMNTDGLDIEKLDEFIGLVRKARNELDIMKATEIHLFVQGPVTAGILIGSQFEQWKLVKLYSQNMQTRQYEFWCLLEK